MIKKQPTQQELFTHFIKEFELSQLCSYCLNSYYTHSHLVKFPDEEFFRYVQICDKCIHEPKIEVK